MSSLSRPTASRRQMAEEAARLVDAMPLEKAQALLEFARYLADRADEDAWERRLGDPQYATKLGSMLSEARREIAEGKAEALDPNRL